MESPDPKAQKWIDECEEIGEPAVREQLAAQRWGPHNDPRVKLAEAWLAEKETERVEAHRKTEALQTLDLVDLAREANETAKEANALAQKAVNWVGWEAFGIALTAAIALAALAKSFGVFD